MLAQCMDNFLNRQYILDEHISAEETLEHSFYWSKKIQHKTTTDHRIHMLNRCTNIKMFFYIFKYMTSYDTYFSYV